MIVRESHQNCHGPNVWEGPLHIGVAYPCSTEVTLKPIVSLILGNIEDVAVVFMIMTNILAMAM